MPGTGRRPRGERGSGKGLFLIGLVTGISGALLILAICYLGLYVQNAVESGQSMKNAASGGPSFLEGSAIDSSVLNKMQTLENTINNYFYLHDVTDEELQDGIYRGMLQALGDPYSEYYTAEELNELMEHQGPLPAGLLFLVRSRDSLSQPTLERALAALDGARVLLDDWAYDLEAAARCLGRDPDLPPLMVLCDGAGEAVYSDSGYRVGAVELALRLAGGMRPAD